MSIKSRFTAVLSAITGNTEPAPKAPRKGEQTAQLAKARGTIGEHPSKGLTPQKLHQILEGAEDGDITAQSELFADMEEKDGHIFAEMSKRKRALTGLDWRVPRGTRLPARRGDSQPILPRAATATYWQPAHVISARPALRLHPARQLPQGRLLRHGRVSAPDGNGATASCILLQHPKRTARLSRPRG